MTWRLVRRGVGLPYTDYTRTMGFAAPFCGLVRGDGSVIVWGEEGGFQTICSN